MSCMNLGEATARITLDIADLMGKHEPVRERGNAMVTPDRETYTLPELFKILGISRPVGYELAKQNALPVPVIRIGEYRSVVSKRAVEELLNRPPAPAENRNEVTEFDTGLVWSALLRLARIETFLIERLVSLEHAQGIDNEQAEDMLDVLEELRADIHAQDIANRKRMKT